MNTSGIGADIKGNIRAFKDNGKVTEHKFRHPSKGKLSEIAKEKGYDPMTEKKHILKNVCWITILLISIGFIVYGWVGREEWETVLEKATNICFQCIGLG